MMLHHYTAPAPRMTEVGRVDVRLIAEELEASPHFWNQHRLRTENPVSPHREADDIWVRFNALENLDSEHPERFSGEHESVWYPCAAFLPNVRDCVQLLARKLEAETIGGVLLTRIPSKSQVYWHTDAGWHAKVHRKFCVCIAANHEQSFEFDGESMRSDTGDVFEFENAYRHRVCNPSDSDRISMIVCLRDFSE